MKKLWILALTGFLAACNDSNNSTSDVPSDSSLRPRPINEAITNDTRIVNDSVIVPDTNNVGPNPSEGVDTVGPIRKMAAQKNQNNQNNRNNNGQ